MKIKELKEFLNSLPDDYEVVVPAMTHEKVAKCVSCGEYSGKKDYGEFLAKNSHSYQKTNCIYIR